MTAYTYQHTVRLLIFSLVLALPISAHAQTAPAVPAAILQASSGFVDPIAFVGHGKLFGPDGQSIEPSPDFVRLITEQYIQRLQRQADSALRERTQAMQSQLANVLAMDEMAQRFLLLEWLTEQVAPGDQASLFAKNRTLRREWYHNVYGEERYKELMDEQSDLPIAVADLDLTRSMLRKATTATGDEYIRQCREAGVPIPPNWRDEGPGKWNHVGDLSTNFLGFGTPASVYRYDSTSPAGLCMALPRFSSNDIDALGVICMGRESSNVCFFDAKNVGKNDPKDINTFLSGGSLGSTGTCTDCHAGENPYVVHPGGPLNMTPDHFTRNWYVPLVRPDWPQNPGPFTLLSQVPINPLPPTSDGDCESCHKKPYVGLPDLGNSQPGTLVAGRFPDVVALEQSQSGSSGYCNSVLLKAMGSTMPGGGSFAIHADAMRAFCSEDILPGETVPTPDADDNPEVVSPPIVLGPLYACAEAVEVNGGVYGAKLTVSIDGTSLPPVVITMPSQTIVATPPLVAGQKVSAIQEVDGLPSGPAPETTVIDHTLAFPSGLPVPIIDPQVIYQCGRTIAVRHVRGARVTVFTNGGDDITYSTGGEWTNLPPRIRPFNLGDEYTAQQHLCMDSSDPSFPEKAGPEPNPLPVPMIEPAPPLAGQEVVNLSNLPEGAATTVSESSVGDLTSFGTAVTWQPEVDVATGLGRPIATGDQLAVVSELCESSKISFPEAQSCESLPAPIIQTPLVGATSVYVIDAVPGARILVYDASLNEIGDGSGSQIGLTRALVSGDILIVTQRLGECASNEAFQIAAACVTGESCR